MSGGRLVIRRPRGRWFDVLRRYCILVDGVEVGRLRRGGRIELSPAPGTRVIEARIDWCSAPPLRVEIRADAPCLVEVANAKGLAGALTANEIRDPGNYLRLTLVSGTAAPAGPWG